MPVRFLITTLRPGVDPETYECWVRERDYPFVASLPNVISYQVHRIRNPIEGAAEAGWMYFERIEVHSMERHQEDLASAAGQQIRAELFGFLDRPKIIAFTSDIIE